MKQCVSTHLWYQPSGRSERSMDFRSVCYIVIFRPAWVTDPAFGDREGTTGQGSLWAHLSIPLPVSHFFGA